MNSIKYSISLLLVLSSAPACSQNGWESSPPDSFVPRIENELKEQEYFVVPSSDLERAESLLSQKVVVELSETDAKAFLTSAGKDIDVSSRYFLARAVSDRRNGAYSIYLERGVLRIFWGGFGPCYSVLDRAAIVVKSRESINSAYASCSGVD